MSRASSIPDVIDALVACFTAALGEGAVNDGPGATQSDGNLYVFVGANSLDDDGATTAAESEQEWAWLGHTQRDETVTVHCVIRSWNGDGDQKSARDEAYRAMKAITDAIEAAPDLGGSSVVYDIGVTSHVLMQDQDPRGASVVLPFDFKCKTRP